MQKEQILAVAKAFVQDSPLNYVSETQAKSADLVGMRIFEDPLMAVGKAADALYTQYKDPAIIGGHFMTPGEWLPGAQSVVAFFLPFSEKIKTANSIEFSWPANEWLHGRIEGQVLLNALSLHMEETLRRAGYAAVAPSCDPRFKSAQGDKKFTSNWSERHAGFACGLGTFGLSRGLITAKGVAGRFTSLITELELPSDSRPYSGIYEYCSNCGVCAINCPVQAITLEEGKKHAPCSAFIDEVKEQEHPYYGCGKCQVAVPCMDGIPC